MDRYWKQALGKCYLKSLNSTDRYFYNGNENAHKSESFYIICTHITLTGEQQDICSRSDRHGTWNIEDHTGRGCHGEPSVPAPRPPCTGGPECPVRPEGCRYCRLLRHITRIYRRCQARVVKSSTGITGMYRTTEKNSVLEITVKGDNLKGDHSNG